MCALEQTFAPGVACKLVRSVMPPLAVACAVILGSIGSAAAQAYPSRPITMIVPFAAGGPTDTVGRIMAEHMRMVLGQSVIIENVGGASGSLGTGRVARAPPDGYTVVLGTIATHVFNGAIYKLPYDVQKDFDPVALIASNPQLIVAKKNMPANNLKELIAWLKANPDRGSQATSGTGGASHVAGAFFQKETGTRFAFVPYRGGNLLMQDLLAGHVDLMIDQAVSALPHVRTGAIKAYAVTAKSRLAAAPDIPTVDEAGLPGFYTSIWTGLWAPARTPKDVIAKLNAAAVKALTDPAVRQRLAELGQETAPREQLTPEALSAYQTSEIEKWWPIIRAANIKAE